jgi:poly(A) polymerase
MNQDPTDKPPQPTAPSDAPDGAAPDLDPASFDPDAVKVVSRLQQHGHQAYFVGGCVRDLLVGRKPKDFDVATSAHPGEVRATFRNCRLIGRRFRLAHVYFKGGKIIEVSTFRDNPGELEERPPPEADANPPEEGEEPREAQPNGESEPDAEEDLLITQDNVFGTAEQDARRRDFTINGLFYDFASGKVIDYVRGRRDLDERYIRTIGDPERRMREDPVRILRAVRFASKLEFDIESRTYAAMEGAVEDLPRCAPPRLLEETFRLIRGGVATPSLKLLAALDALKILLPPIADYLAKRGPEGEKAFYAFTETLDRRVLGGVALEDAVLLAAMLLPIALAAPYQEPEGGEQPTVAAAIEDLLADLVRNARLPRRIAERCRLILIAQRTLSGQRRRRGSLMSFRRHPLFNEALTAFEIWVDATGEHREALEKWKSGDAPVAVPDAEGPPKRRRRRRRRRGPRLGADSPPPPKPE